MGNDVQLVKRLEKIKYERAEHAAKRSAAKGWLKEYGAGKAGWPITPERAYITSVFQCNEALRIIIGKAPQAAAPKAIVSDINGLEEFGLGKNILSAILTPPNGKSWDFRWF